MYLSFFNFIKSDAKILSSQSVKFFILNSYFFIAISIIIGRRFLFFKKSVASVQLARTSLITPSNYVGGTAATLFFIFILHFSLFIFSTNGVGDTYFSFFTLYFSFLIFHSSTKSTSNLRFSIINFCLSGVFLPI